MRGVAVVADSYGAASVASDTGDLPVDIATAPAAIQYIAFLRENMNLDVAESYRRAALAKEHLRKYPARASITRTKLEPQIITAYLMGYDQACRDLLSPKEEPGKPATAVTLLNRVGEMVLKNRRELLSTDGRVQCPGCFCLFATELEKEAGWCNGCYPHRTRLVEQVEALRQNPQEATVGAGPQQEGGSDEKA